LNRGLWWQRRASRKLRPPPLTPDSFDDRPDFDTLLIAVFILMLLADGVLIYRGRAGKPTLKLITGARQSPRRIILAAVTF